MLLLFDASRRGKEKGLKSLLALKKATHEPYVVGTREESLLYDHGSETRLLRGTIVNRTKYC